MLCRVIRSLTKLLTLVSYDTKIKAWNRIVQQRPGVKEIDKKLKDARTAVIEKGLLFANPVKAAGELNELDIVDAHELRDLLGILLNEIMLSDYAGSRPPMRSYEVEIADCELWAFSWQSARLEKKMYLKFTLKEKQFYLVSLHACRVNSPK